MKTIYKSLIIVFSIIAFTACNDFLGESPSTSVKTDDAYKDEVAVRTALIGCYSNFAHNNYRGQLYELQQCISLATAMTTTTSTVAASALGEIPANSPHILPSLYQQIYKSLDHVNVFIEKIEKSSFDQNFIDKNAGEAKFLRACMMFDLVRLFGRVPLKTSPTTYLDTEGYPREKISLIYSQIIKDLLDAEETMKEPGEQEIGYPHKWAATAYLAKVYSWVACMTKEHLQATYEEGKQADYTSDAVLMRFYNTIKNEVFPEDAENADSRYFWVKAKDAAKRVVDENVYELLPDYGNLFQGKTRNTNESILELQYSFNATSWGTSISARTSPSNRTEFNPNLLNNTSRGRTCVDWSTFAEHWRKYGDKTPYQKNRMFVTAEEVASGNYRSKPLAIHPFNFNEGSSPIKRSVNRYDPRIDISYVYMSYMRYTLNDVSGAYDVGPTAQTCFPHSGFGPTGRDRAYPFIKKHLDPTQTSTSGSNINFILYRYADLLLLYAEAMNELGETADAINLVNTTILSRARKSGPGSVEPADWNSGLSQDSVRNLIIGEREIELIGEAHETFEFRRRGWEFVNKRIMIHDFWYADPDYGIRHALRNSSDSNDEALKAFTHGDWNRMIYGTKENPTEMKDMGEYSLPLRVYKYYSPYANNVKSFCIKQLFLPIPQQEMNTNRAIPLDDQNYGW